MKASLLQTKLYIPPTSPELISRPRLFERLNEGLTRKLTLIAAPAGFGKTTLVSDWLQQVDLPAAWLSLDEGDNDPSRFLAYLVAALQRIEVQIGQSVQGMLESSSPPPPVSVMPVIINEIAAAPPFVLALDDYDVIDTPPVHDAMTFLLDHLPPQVHVIITSRADPPLPLARLRARAQLTEVRVIDLRFTSDETASFFSQISGLNLSIEELIALEQRTEGWIAGLQLAAASLQGRVASEREAFVDTFAGDDQYIIDYLVEEVLNRQTPDVQSFLMQTAILERFNADLCDAVTGRNDSQAMLNYLAKANLFIIPLDHKRQWYRYHHLFADLLRYRLKETAPNQIPALHQRASQWYENRDLKHEAIHYALKGGDFDRAGQLIEQRMETATYPQDRALSLPTPALPLLEPLTEREGQILRLLVAGLSTPEIAEELIISVGTVRSHIKRLYRKLDAHSRHEAVTRARELGLL
jgi:LuxR family maltose regulon positive regulatory protein